MLRPILHTLLISPTAVQHTKGDKLAILILAVLILCTLAALWHQRVALREERRREQADKERLAQYHALQSARAQEHEGVVATYELNLTKNTCTGSGPLLGAAGGTVDDFTRGMCALLHPDDVPRYMRQMSPENVLRLLDEGVSTVEDDFLLYVPEKGYVWRHICADVLRNPQTDDVEVVAYAIDNDYKRRMEQIAEKVLHTAFTRVALIDVRSGVATSYRRGTLLPRSSDQGDGGLVVQDYETKFMQRFIAIMHEAEYRDLLKTTRMNVLLCELNANDFYDVPLRTREDTPGGERHINLRFSWLSERRECILMCSEDVTQVVASRTDARTGLLNADGFYARAEQWLAEHPERPFTILRYDFDGFKFINTTAGFARANKLLHDFGLFLHGHNTDDSFAGHLNADQFVRFCGDGSIDPKRAAELFQARYRGYPYTVLLHVGVYDLCEPDTDIYLASYRALLALQTIKGNRTQYVAYYTQGMSDRAHQARELLDDVERALEEEQLCVWFQPQYDAGGQLVGAEALVRWQHPEKGMIPPGEFIPLLEYSNLITRVDQYVWEHTCRRLQRWNAEGLYLPASVNVSRMDLQNGDLPEQFTALVAKYGLEPDQLRLEITESAYTDRPEQLAAMVARLRAAGFTVEMDDFGTGYSSLNMLKDIRIDVLKLDMKFLSGGEEARGRQIVQSIVDMAHRLDMRVIAEGVETAQQARELTALGCDAMQGYYFSRPLPPEELEKILRAGGAQSPKPAPAAVMPN